MKTINRESDAPARKPIATKISASKAVSLRFYLAELWDRRDLVRVLAGRQLKSNYEINLVGFAWWLMEPLSFTLVYVILVDVIFKRGEPAYPLFIIIALLPWKWMLSAVSGAMGTIRGNSGLITDVYFPRGLLPLVDIVVGMIHFLVGLTIVPLFMIAYGIYPDWHIVWLPVVVFVQFVFLLGMVYPLAVLGLNFRNSGPLVTQMFRLWFYLSPGIWALSRFEGRKIYNLMLLNPLTGIFEGYRGALYQHQSPNWELFYTFALGVIGVVVGLRFFIRREMQFGKDLG